MMDFKERNHCMTRCRTILETLSPQKFDCPYCGLESSKSRRLKEASSKSVITKGCIFEATLLFSNGVRNEFKFNKKALGVETRTDAQGPFFFKSLTLSARQYPLPFQQLRVVCVYTTSLDLEPRDEPCKA
jgi:hypothetical protein